MEEIRLSGLHYRVFLTAFVKHLLNIGTAFTANIACTGTLIKLPARTSPLFNRLVNLFVRDGFANTYIHTELRSYIFC